MKIYSISEPSSFQDIHFFWPHSLSCPVLWWEGQIGLFWELLLTRRSFETPSHLSDFFDTDLPTIIHNKGWESLCDVSVTCPSVSIQEFYSNMHGFNYLIPLFVTRVQGTRIVVTLDIVFNMLCVPRVEHFDYPGCDRLRIVSKDKLISSFCECPSDWGDRQFTSCSAFAKGPRFLNMIMTFFVFFLHRFSHYNSITEPVLDLCFPF